jgi:pectate lyase/YHS domain-containing protein
MKSYRFAQSFIVQLCLAGFLFIMMVGAPEAWAADNPTQIRFIVSHADCGGMGTFEFFVSGIPVGVYSSTQTCYCNSSPLVVTLNDPNTLSLIGQYGCTSVSMTLNDPAGQSVALGYVRVEIDRSESGTETFCLVDYATSGTCEDRNLCYGYQFPGSITYSNIVNCPDPLLGITPVDRLISISYKGGPFAPLSKNYTLTNNGPNSLDWTAEANMPWLNVSPDSGTLASNQSVAVTISNNADVNNFAIGRYGARIKFTNLTSDINQVRPVTLLVQDIDPPVGWVTMSDGNVPYYITGGALGDTVTVTDATSLKAYATSTLPYVILVSGTITMPRGTSSSDTPQTINLQSNKTIIGIGSNPGVNGGFMISGKSNIIIRNIKIWYEDSIAQGSDDPWTDGISINGSQHIWIDHCSVFDSPDGLIDPTKQSNYLTISWCKFYYTANSENTLHRNCCLVGSSDTDTADRGKLKETFHHNWWGNGCKERMPRVRFGKVHVFNNYYSDLRSGGYCQGVGVECQIKVENNYYNAVPLLWKNYSQAGIQGKIGWNTGSFLYNCTVPTWAPNDYDNIFVPPYPYTLDTGADVKDIVMTGAGADPDGDITPPTPNPMTFATAPYAASYTSIAMVAATASDVHGVEYYFTCTNYGGIDSGWQDSPSYTAVNLSPSTTYIYTVKARDKSNCQNETAASSPASATTLDDVTPPTPDPMSFATAPYALSDSSIRMVATTAIDVSGVEYYFTCTAGIGHNSGWQDSPTYIDTGLTENSTCTYTVKARDKSIAHNQTADSDQASATTLPDTTPPTPNPMTFDVAPYAIDSHSISMTAATATDSSGVEYYFTNVTDTNHNSGWQNSATYTDTGLAEGATYSYTVTARDKHPQHHTTAPSNPETTTTMTDTTAPTPNPMLFEFAPYPVSSTSIVITAATAADISGVEYYFANVTDPNHNSSWQDSRTYTDANLLPSTMYTYKIKARDKSANHNETAWSPAGWTTTLDDATPPTPNPMTWAVAPKATGNNSITMTATTAIDISGVEYYFANVTDYTHDSGWVSSPVWTDTGLAKNTTYSYAVFAHDKSINYNETGSSDEASATTLNYDCSSHIDSDLDNNCQVDFLDYYIMAETWAGNWLDILQFAEDWLSCHRTPADQCWQ